MRTITTVSTFVFVALSIVACTASTEPEEDAIQVESALQRNDDYTTRDICTKCGCVATDVACNCGTPPRPKKLECIRNGGPSKVFAGSAVVR